LLKPIGSALRGPLCGRSGPLGQQPSAENGKGHDAEQRHRGVGEVPRGETLSGKAARLQDQAAHEERADAEASQEHDPDQSPESEVEAVTQPVSCTTSETMMNPTLPATRSFPYW
jgi:hypothetical protein